MSHLISVEIDSEVAKKLLEQLSDSRGGKFYYSVHPTIASDVRLAIEEALENDDA